MSTAALLLETLRLSGPHETAPLREAWSRAECRGLADLMRWEEAAPWLWRRLVSLGAAEVLPERVAALLRAAAAQAAAQGLLVDVEAETTVRWLASRGVPCVLLKGTARRAAAALYPYADARGTRDVDLLLPEGEVERLWQELRDAGYPLATDPEATPPGHYHPPPLVGPSGVGVELHAATSHDVGAAEAWRRATVGADRLAWRGLSVTVPPPTELLWHGLAHALPHEARAFNLRYLLDGAVVLAAARPIEWTVIATRLDTETAEPQRARAWLHAAADLAGTALPPSVGAPRRPFPLERALAWRLAVARRFVSRPRVREALVEEGTRAELAMPRRAMVPGTSLAAHARRWCSALAARGGYYAWRLARGAGGHIA